MITATAAAHQQPSDSRTANPKCAVPTKSQAPSPASSNREQLIARLLLLPPTPTSKSAIECHEERAARPGTCISDEVFAGALVLCVLGGRMTITVPDCPEARLLLRTGRLSYENDQGMENDRAIGTGLLDSDALDECDGQQLRLRLTKDRWLRIPAGLPVSWLIDDPSPCQYWVATATTTAES